MEKIKIEQHSLTGKPVGRKLAFHHRLFAVNVLEGDARNCDLVILPRRHPQFAPALTKSVVYPQNCK
jgi:hypothetical protein